MIPKEIMILAGGSGTRIQEKLPGLPKALAPIGDKTFIDHLIHLYVSKGIERFVFCLGEYKDQLIKHIEINYPRINKAFVCESQPLGTGGAVKNALAHCRDNNILIVNGDTYFPIDLESAATFHDQTQAECTLVLKPSKDLSRFGKIKIGDNGRVTQFLEKAGTGEGLINGGTYLLNKQAFLQHQLPDIFSFEKEYLEKYFDRARIFGLSQDVYFIDIGIPEDLARAQTELMDITADWISKIDKHWTLFLDRDGVINIEKEDDYIRHWDEFYFIDGVLDALPVFARKFGRIVIVTNQKGVGKGLMSEENLAEINTGIHEMVNGAGGRIDKIYYCIALEDSDPYRKPNPGMAYMAKAEFPEIDFNRSLMVGNTMGDMKFGKACGMYTVFIPSGKPMPAIPNPLIDQVFPSLYDLAKAL
ncbi:MAG TPA: HAD-IIIA family hydrolase [Chitinophagaceae bacterium]|nr:HAD-IIIA family hydrolase [Chitinophagaceae bacterium]